MPRKPAQELTEAELRLMNILWQRGPGTVNEVVGALPADPPLAYNTVLTTLRILERKGFVRHSKHGRAFTYETLVDIRDASASAVRRVLARFFNNSPELLVANLLKTQSLRKGELDRIRKLIGDEPQKEQRHERSRD